VSKPNSSRDWHIGPQPLTWRKYELTDKDTDDRDEISSCCTWRHRADQRDREIGQDLNLFCLALVWDAGVETVMQSIARAPDRRTGNRLGYSRLVLWVDWGRARSQSGVSL